jgi:hypothetical protein
MVSAMPAGSTFKRVSRRRIVQPPPRMQTVPSQGGEEGDDGGRKAGAVWIIKNQFKSDFYILRAGPGRHVHYPSKHVTTGGKHMHHPCEHAVWIAADVSRKE